MKIKCLKLKNWLMMAIGGLLGINFSCNKSPVASEYGCPRARYTVKGQVANTEGAAIGGIRVGLSESLADFSDSLSWSHSCNISTDSAGQYEISASLFPDADTLYVGFCDIDSIEGGRYADTVVGVSFKDVPLIGGDGNWNHGSATVTRNVQLRSLTK